MFSIDTKRINIKNTKTGETTRFYPGNEKDKPENDFDLPNENVYDLKGNIIEEAINPDSYNLAFAVDLSRLPILKCIEFLNHHFERTPDKEKFLLHIRYNTLIFPFIKDEQKEKFDFVVEWIEEKNKQLKLYKNFIPIQNDFLFDRVPFEIAMIYSHPLPDSEEFGYGPRYIQVKRNNFFFYTEYISWTYFTEKVEAGKLFDEELNKLSFENLDIYFNSYADGFIKGYTEFDNRISSATKIFKDDTPAIKKIYEYANSPISGLTIHTIKSKGKKDFKVINKELWNDAGIKEGEKYRAWVLIIDNPSQYLNLFRNESYFETYCRKAYAFWENKKGRELFCERLSKVLVELNSVKPSDNSMKSGISIAAIAIFYFFLCKYEDESPITKTNASKIAEEFNWKSSTSGQKLFEFYKRYKNDAERRNIGKDNGRAYQEHLKRYEMILPLLTNYTRAYEEANKEYEYLKGK